MFGSNYLKLVPVLIIILLLSAGEGVAGKWQDIDLNVDGKEIDFEFTTISESDRNLDGNYESRIEKKYKGRYEFKNCKTQKICVTISKPLWSLFFSQGEEVLWDIGFEDDIDKIVPEVIDYEGDIPWFHQVQLYFMKHAQKSKGIINPRGEFRGFPGYESRMKKLIEQMKVINADTREVEGVKKYTRARTSKKSARSAVEFFYAYLPKRPVIEGESWRNKIIFHEWYPKVCDFIYTLEEITSEHYILNISGAMSEFEDVYPRRLHGNAMRQEVVGLISGRVLVNRETNFPDSLQINTAARIVLRYWPEGSFEEWGSKNEYNTKITYKFEIR